MTSDYSNRQGDVTSAHNHVRLIQSSYLVCVGAAIINSLSGNVRSSARVSAGRVSSSDTISHPGFLVKSAQFAGMYGAMLGATGTGGRPAAYGFGVGLNRKNKLSVDILDVAPINDAQRKWVTNSNTLISKKQRGFLYSNVNCEDQKKNHQTEGDVFTESVLRISKNCEKHSYRKEIAQSAVDSRATRSENYRISAGLVQSPEWSSNHE